MAARWWRGLAVDIYFNFTSVVASMVASANGMDDTLSGFVETVTEGVVVT